jgi:hypothetical protein
LNQSLHDVSIYYLLKALESRVNQAAIIDLYKKVDVSRLVT